MDAALVASGGMGDRALTETVDVTDGATPAAVDTNGVDTNSDVATAVEGNGDAPALDVVNSETIAADDSEIAGYQFWRVVRWSLVAVYAVGYIWWFFRNGIIIDRISVLLSVTLFMIVANVGKPWHDWARMARDAAIFAAMWIAYDESRGIADGLGFPIQVESVRNIDRFLFLGTDPVVWLQRRFYEGADSIRWYDVAGSIVYYSHFIVPPVTIAVLYLVNRLQWVRYMQRFATVLFISCAMFILLPTAPPWMAAGGKNRVGLDVSVLPPLRRPTGNGWRHIGLGAFVKAWDTGRDWANQVAALPSLHSAFAMFVVLFFFRWVTDWRLRVLMLLYPLSMAIALMYFAEHYLIDALVGWAIVGFSFFIWNRIDRRRANRSTPPESRPLAHTLNLEDELGQSSPA